jgi:hypothetical protein
MNIEFTKQVIFQLQDDGYKVLVDALRLYASNSEAKDRVIADQLRELAMVQFHPKELVN